MVFELKKGIESGKVLYGIKQSVKNSKKLNKAFVAADCRDDIIFLLEDNKMDIEFLDFSKEELTTKLELDFKCEVFGLKK